MKSFYTAIIFTATLTSLGMAASSVLFGTSESDPPAIQPVNEVLGDESFVRTFSFTPTARTDEQLRLRTHLAYVEGLLRAREVDHLAPKQRANRFRLLNALNAYWKRGIFPRNTEQVGRTPVFIDDAGRLCAVGYLVAESAGRAVAEAIDERYHLASISEMSSDVINKWAKKHGFTRHELAMIQPSYDSWPPGPGPDPDPIPNRNEKITEGVEIAAMAVNASAALANGLMIGLSERNRLIAGIGILSGGAGLVLGLSGEANYATADVALAGASIFLSGWQLLRPEEDRQPALAVRPAVISDKTGNSALGLHVNWRF